jgi:predicted regulator of Ras-like GTPase activity (Roadblock/LC7/MglB family)
MIEVRKLINELDSIDGVLGAGIVSKDGRTIEVRVPDNMNTEIISIMVATVYGAAVTLHTEAGRESPDNIFIKTDGFDTLIWECGARALVMVMASDNCDLSLVETTVQKLKKEFISE